jgi:hypothetical protein
VVSQVKVVGILMLIHGIFVCLMGGILAAMGPVMLMAPGGPGGGGPPTILAVIYIAIGAVVLACGAVQSIAGYRVMYFRNRAFGLVALFLNILPMLTCYCAPTGIAMMVYGLIILFNSDVARGFEMVAGGATPDDVLRELTYRFGDTRDDYDDNYGSQRNWEERRRGRPNEADFDDDYGTRHNWEEQRRRRRDEDELKDNFDRE